MLVEPKYINQSETDQCYLGVFRSQVSYGITWMIGNKFMRKYYMVFDQTPYEEDG